MLSIICLLPAAGGLLFAPSDFGLWDQTGLVGPDGTWMMWWDARNETPGGRGELCGFGLATSMDGVLWTDHGITMRPFDQPTLGSGAVWRSPVRHGTGSTPHT